MKCAACHEALEHKHGEIELRIHGKLFLVENVSYYECPACGERTLSPDVSQCLFEKITKKQYEEKALTVPVGLGFEVVKTSRAGEGPEYP